MHAACFKTKELVCNGRTKVDREAAIKKAACEVAVCRKRQTTPDFNNALKKMKVPKEQNQVVKVKIEGAPNNKIIK